MEYDGCEELLLTLLPAFGREFEVEPMDDEICRGGRLDPLDCLVDDGRFELTLRLELEGRFLLPPDLLVLELLFLLNILDFRM